MPALFFTGPRPGPDWNRHGVTTKNILTIVDDTLVWITLHKQRWLNRPTGRTRHDRPVYDIPGSPFGFDVVVTVLAAWLLGTIGIHNVAWPWDDERPAARTVQRWAARLAPHAQGWLQRARTRIIEHVAPRPLGDLLPTAGIPPPEGARLRNSQGKVATAGQLRDVCRRSRRPASLRCNLRTAIALVKTVKGAPT